MHPVLRWSAAIVPVLACLSATGIPRPGAAPPDPVVRHFLSGEANDWEPSLDVGGAGRVAVIAVRRGQTLPLPARTVVWTSDDRGRSFRAPLHPAPDLDFQGDPRIRVDGEGTIYGSWVGIDFDSAGAPEPGRGGLVLARSGDGGRSFRTEAVVDLAEVGDKPELAVSEDGRELYIAFTGRGGTLEVTASHDGGGSWERHTPDSTRALYWPTSIALGPDGDVWITHPRLLGTLADTLRTYELELVGSRDGGRTWRERSFDRSTGVARPPGPGELPVTVCTHGPPCPRQLPYPVVAVDARNRVYLAYTAGTAGTAGQPYDLRFQRSGDGGRTWSTSRALSSAPRPTSGDRAEHYYPMIAASGDGLVYVVWFDDRTGPLNVWARRSVDGGESWSDDVRLSRTDRDGFPGIYGDYGGLAIDDEGALHAVWAEGTGHVSQPEGAGGVWYARWERE